MTGTDYNVALAVFFVPYVLCEVPSNLILTMFSRPSTYIGMLVVAWGIVMTLFGVVQSFGGLVAARFFLGVFEYVLPSLRPTSTRLPSQVIFLTQVIFTFQPLLSHKATRPLFPACLQVSLHP